MCFDDIEYELSKYEQRRRLERQKYMKLIADTFKDGELIFDMVRPGGIILADKVLWDGKVCQDPLPQDKQTLGIVKFNDMVSADPRVESVILPLRDGLNMIRKK